MIDLSIEKAELVRNPAWDAFDVHIVTRRIGRDVEVLCPLSSPVIMRLTQGEASPGAAFRLERESAQALLDALWSAGFRPSSGIDRNELSAHGREVEAMREHLADLRRVVFGQSVIVGPDVPRTIMSDNI